MIDRHTPTRLYLLVPALSAVLLSCPAQAQLEEPTSNANPNVQLRRHCTYSLPGRPANAASPKIVVDNVNREPLHFRTCIGLAEKYKAKGSIAGLATLSCSGSAAFTVAQMNSMLEELVGQVVVVDLRQEPHAYITGFPLTWEAENDWYSVGMSPQQAKAAEDDLYWKLRGQLKVQAEVASPSPAGQEPSMKNTSLSVRNVQTQEEVIRDLGLGYQRFFVTDHLRPDDATVDQFVQFVDRLGSDTWLHFHCRGGKGRTTTFMTMYDMMRNAPKVSFADIVARQACLDPNYDVTAVRPDSPRTNFYSQRLEFLEAFYSYCSERNKSKQAIRWSVWTRVQ